MELTTGIHGLRKGKYSPKGESEYVNKKRVSGCRTGNRIRGVFI